MFKQTILMYGLPYEHTTARQVEVELPDDAGMADVIAAMREKIPSLEGPVFRTGQDRLQEAYKFNINGNFYYDGMDFVLRPEDRIALLVPVTGG